MIWMFPTHLSPTGDHVVVMHPSYQSLYAHAHVIGCRVTEWRARLVSGQHPQHPQDPPDQRWEFSLEELRACFSRKRVRMLVVNFPHNPVRVHPPI